MTLAVGKRESHGKCHSPEYAAWTNMKTRCYNNNFKDWNYYGGRGIVVCERWKDSFTNFLLDMGNRPSGKYSLDRIDSDRDYEPNNCRWADAVTQALNRKKDFKISVDNKLGVKGVRKHYHKYLAKKSVNGIVHYLGSFDTVEDASSAYKRFVETL